jgi:hypothetical protein
VETMDYLVVRFKLTHDTLAERSLLVRPYELDEEEEQLGKTLEVQNVPYFMEESELQKLFPKCNQVDVQEPKKSVNLLRNRSALIRYESKVKLEKELRLIKHSIEAPVLYDSNVSDPKTMQLPIHI